MGVIKKVLDTRKLKRRDLHNSRLFVDLSENVHIHFREIRIMFGVDEFFEFANILKSSARDIKKYLMLHPNYKEQEIFEGLMVAGGRKRQTTPLKKSPKPHQSKYFDNRLQIELQDEKVIDPIHIHFRDYRLVMSIETFKEFAYSMHMANKNLDKYLKKNKYKPKPHPFRKVVKSKEWKDGKVTLLDKTLYALKSFLGRTETN